MPKEKKHLASEESLPSKGDSSNTETERRLTTLEKQTVDLNNRIFDSHKWFVTILFSAVAVVLTVYGVMSRLDVKDSTAEMEKRVDSKTSEMEKKFAALSGEALKKPLLEISDIRGPLDGRVFEISQNGPVPFNPLFFKNVGDKRTEPLSIQLSVSSDLFMNGGSEWQRTATDDQDYPFSYYSSEAVSSRTAGIGIAPQETWPLQFYEYNQRIFSPTTNAVTCKLKVFYGAEKPAEAKFIIKFK